MSLLKLWTPLHGALSWQVPSEPRSPVPGCREPQEAAGLVTCHQDVMAVGLLQVPSVTSSSGLPYSFPQQSKQAENRQVPPTATAHPARHPHG